MIQIDTKPLEYYKKNQQFRSWLKSQGYVDYYSDICIIPDLWYKWYYWTWPRLITMNGQVWEVWGNIEEANRIALYYSEVFNVDLKLKHMSDQNYFPWN